MRWRNRDGNHETYDDQILMDLLDLLWWICTAKFWRHNGLAMSCGETLHFFQTCLIFYKLWTPDSQSLTPGLKKTSFAFGYLLFEMPLGRHQDTEFWWVLQKKLENLGFQVGRNSIYIYIHVSIFCFKCLWESIKTPSFAQNNRESGLAGVGSNKIIWI
jgi:hypothetical protein